jgi:hypothetical protein
MSISLTPVPQKLSRKQARKLIYEKLSGALAEYKNNFKEKKFENTLKKASKMFASDLSKTIGKKKEVKANKKKVKTRKKEKKQAIKEVSASVADLQLQQG